MNFPPNHAALEYGNTFAKLLIYLWFKIQYLARGTVFDVDALTVFNTKITVNTVRICNIVSRKVKGFYFTSIPKISLVM